LLKSKDVSVVIPFYNGSRWIERALQSVAAQTFKPKEVLIVNDGSEETELAFLEGLQSRFIFKVLNQKNGGQSSARNFGIREASCEFICLLDQDDYFLPNHIELLLKAVDPSDSMFGFSYGDLWRESESGLVLAHSCVNLESQHPHTDLKALLGTNMYILPSAALISRSAFMNVGGFDPELRGYEDDDFFLRLFLAGYTNRFIPDAVTVWTLNTSSTSFTESMARSRFIYFKKLMKLFPEGSVPGTRVFGDFIFKRFARQFAHDVVASAFNKDKFFAERVSRLREFRSHLRASGEVPSRNRTRFLVGSLPLVTLNGRVLRFVLQVALQSRLFYLIPGSEVARELIRRYLPRKK
jgi:GT2 family glycosyltransferase